MNNLNNLIIKEYVSVILYQTPKEIWVSKRINPLKEFYQHWQCPGGHVEPLDPSSLFAAQREVLEETGIKMPLKEIDYRRSNHYIIGNEWRIVHIYFYKTNEQPKLTEPKEMTEWYLKPLEEVLEEKTIDSLRDAFYGRQKYTQKIFIEGNCGAGKSTLAKLLKEHYEKNGKTVELMDESFITQDPQERIITYGNDLARYKENKISQAEIIKEAVKLETWIRDKWMEQIYKFTVQETKPDILIVDRNLFSTLIFMELMHKEGIYPIREKYNTAKNYHYWYFWKREAHIIWWKTPINESIKRLINRNRSGEQNIDYYKNLNQVYEEKMLRIYPNVEVITKETLLTEEQLKELLPIILRNI